MIGLCGWFGGGGVRDDAAVLLRMAQATGGHSQDGFSRSDAKFGIYQSTVPRNEVAPNGDIVIALAGRVHWIDKELQQTSQTYGDRAAAISAYRQFGDLFLHHIHGHFSLALFDLTKGVAIIAVDRIGAQPMCYAFGKDGTFVFGSSADTVRAHPELNSTLSKQALYDYLYFHMIPSPDTIYRDIKKLEPAQCLRFENGKVKLSHYWQPAFVDHGRANVAELEDEFLKLLRTSVQRCSPDDATGAFLSGGTDSSTVSGMLAGLRTQPIKTYSMGFSQDGYDEISYARIASKHFHTDQHEYYVTAKDVAEAFPAVAQAYDEPFGNSSAIPTYFCAKLAQRDGTRVMLAGDGGDELFGGNARYAKQKVFDVYHGVPQWLRSGLVEPLFLGLPFAQWSPPTRKVRSYIEQARMPMPDRMESYNFLQRSEASGMFNPGFITQADTQHPLHLLRDTYNRTPSQNLLHRMLFLDWKFTLADNDLRKVNRMCTLAGVEVRYPMLDDDLVEFSARVPPDLKLKGLKLRYFFKHALRNFLPTEIINKSKHGFGLPFGEWLKTSPELQDVVYSNLRDFKARQLVQPEFIDNLITSHRSGHAAYYGTLIWVLAMLEQWLQQHKASL